MFGLPSLTKLLVLAAVVAAVWYGFKIVGRMDAARKAEAKLHEGKASRGKAKTPGRRAEAGTPEEMVQCPVCKTYMPSSGARACGRPDCPY